jgi:hypothetical protein
LAKLLLGMLDRAEGGKSAEKWKNVKCAARSAMAQAFKAGCVITHPAFVLTAKSGKRLKISSER